MAADIQVVLDRVLALLAPPERLSLAAWCDQHRVLSPEGSAAPGPWRTLPFQREPLECLEPGSPYERVVFVWASQMGKSELLLNSIAYVICLDPGPAMLVEPTLDMAATFSQDRLAPLFRDMPALRGRVADAKSRDSGNTIFHKRFHGGHLTLIGSNSPSGLAARPIRFLLLDEVDRYEPSVGTEGDPVSLAIARTRTFFNRKIVMVSSPTTRGASRIEAAWLESDQREFELPCPHCNHYQQLRWERLEWPEGQLEAAAYRCEACNELIEHHHKADMVAHGRWQAKATASGKVAGFHLSEMVSPWRSWGDLALDWLQTVGQPERRRTFLNTTLAEWETEESAPMPSAEVLALRAEAYPAEVPMPAVLLTAGCDLQSDRLECEVTGWARGYESWSIGYYTIVGDPSAPHLWLQLDELLSREFKHQSGMPLRISCAAIDSGYLTDEVCQFTKDKFSRKIFAVKGRSAAFGQPIWPKRPIYNRRQLPLFLISSDESKRWLFQRLRITEPGSGYCHFPVGRPLDYYRGLLSETLVRRFREGRPHLEWLKTYERNEPLDTRSYSIAALFALLMSGLNLDQYVEAFERLLTPTPGAETARPNGMSASGPQVFKSKFLYGS